MSNEEAVKQMSNTLLLKLQGKARTRLSGFLKELGSKNYGRAITLLNVYELVLRELALREEDPS